MIPIVLVVIAVAVLLLLLSGETGTIGGLATDDFGPAVYYGVIALAAAAFLAQAGRFRLGRIASYILVWAGLFLAAVTGYSYRDELTAVAERIRGELLPGAPVALTGTDGTATVRVRRALDGHFGVTAVVNGVSIDMVVDTGASTVTLTERDARAAGFTMKRADYAHPVGTANGVVRMARIRLDEVRVGSIRMGPLEALVAPRAALDHSLLGLNFLNRLQSYEVRGNTLSLQAP